MYWNDRGYFSDSFTWQETYLSNILQLESLCKIRFLQSDVVRKLYLHHFMSTWATKKPLLCMYIHRIHLQHSNWMYCLVAIITWILYPKQHMGLTVEKCTSIRIGVSSDSRVSEYKYPNLHTLDTEVQPSYSHSSWHHDTPVNMLWFMYYLVHPS